MTALTLTIVLVTVALVCVVAWTQAAIWRRMDRIEDAAIRDYSDLDTQLGDLRHELEAQWKALPAQTLDQEDSND